MAGPRGRGPTVDFGIRSDPPLKDLAKALKEADAALARKLGRANKSATADMVETARGNARSMGGLPGKAADAINPSATRTAVQIVVANTPARPWALVAFLGAKARTGWYAWSCYDEDWRPSAGIEKRRWEIKKPPVGAPQHLPWVGNMWEAGAGNYGSEPYAINPAIRSHLPKLLEEYGLVFEELFNEAFRATNPREYTQMPT